MSLIQEALIYKQVHTATKVGLSWLTRSSSSKKRTDLKVLKIVNYVINSRQKKMWSVNERGERLKMNINISNLLRTPFTIYDGKPLIYE